MRNWLRITLLVLNGLFLVGLALSYLAAYVSPEQNAVLPFFGLAFPILLIGNLCFMIFWLIVQRPYFLPSALFILMGINPILDYWQFSPKGSPINPGAAQLKVMSYNVRLFDLYNWSNNKTTRNQMFDLIQGEDPDIVCFQEFYVREDDDRFKTRDTLKQFLRANQVHEGYTHHLVEGQHFGLATFSAYPIVNGGEISFSNDPNNHCIFTDIAVQADTIRVYNVHLASIRFQQGETGSAVHVLSRLSKAFRKRSKQSQIVKAHFNKSPYPIIVCGDFNDSPVSFSYRELSQGLVDAFKVSGHGSGNTYIGDAPSYRIDYILHDMRLHSYGYERHPEAYSDHHAISCWVEMR